MKPHELHTVYYIESKLIKIKGPTIFNRIHSKDIAITLKKTGFDVERGGKKVHSNFRASQISLKTLADSI